MASCIKCGQRKLRKDSHGRRKCKRCGVNPSNNHLDRSGLKNGEIPAESLPVTACGERSADAVCKLRVKLRSLKQEDVRNLKAD